MSLGEKLLNSFFASASPRTAGFNAIDYGQAHPITLMGTDILMFIGGGSAGTAGGIKVTTACVLLAAMAAEFTGRETTTIGHRSLPRSVTRQALALSFAGVMVVTLGVAALRGDALAKKELSSFSPSDMDDNSPVHSMQAKKTAPATKNMVVATKVMRAVMEMRWTT